jgi:hypothetical protein
MRVRRRVLDWHLVKFCAPSPCSQQRPVAIVDYRLVCGHVLRLRHFGPKARQVREGKSAIPDGGWDCPVCCAATIYALAAARNWLCLNRA